MDKKIELQTEETILENKQLRDELVGREDVLHKVKDLLLMPVLDLIPAQNVADFYEVPVETIRTTVKMHKEELESDGMVKVSRGQALERIGFNQPLVNVVVNKCKSHIEIIVGESVFKVSNCATWMFPKRAILRVGMLLRDSTVAKEVRTQLLNIEEMVAPEVKVQAINDELSLIKNALIDSYLDDNFDKYSEAMIELSKYKNRHKDEVIDKLKTENLMLKDAYAELESKTNILAEEISFIPDHETFREVFISMMCRLRKKRKFTSEYLCYKEVYSVLRSRYGIDLTARYYNEGKASAKLDYVKDAEWPILLKLALSMCYRFNVDVSDLVPRLEEKINI